jgi:hypothetical protein
MLLAGAACLALAGPASAAKLTIETHDAWIMECYPEGAAPFFVGVSVAKRTLGIMNTRGGRKAEASRSLRPGWTTVASLEPSKPTSNPLKGSSMLSTGVTRISSAG